MSGLLGNTFSQFSQNVFNSLNSLVTIPPIVQTIIGTEEPVTEKIIEKIQHRISKPHPYMKFKGSGNKISPEEALHRLKLAERRRRLKMKGSGSSSRQSGSDRADVVFFPTDGSGGDNAGCEDSSVGGGGFNTFSFLAFLLAGFNAISVVSNNNNNRERTHVFSVRILVFLYFHCIVVIYYDFKF